MNRTPTKMRSGTNSASIDTYRSSCPEVFCKKGVLRNFAKSTGKHLCQSLFFNKVASPGLAKFLRTSFFIEHLWWLLLYLPNRRALFQQSAKHWTSRNQAGIYSFEVINGGTRTCEICSKLTIKTPERGYSRHSGVFTVNFGHISHLFLVSIDDFEQMSAGK